MSRKTVIETKDTVTIHSIDATKSHSICEKRKVSMKKAIKELKAMQKFNLDVAMRDLEAEPDKNFTIRTMVEIIVEDT